MIDNLKTTETIMNKLISILTCMLLALGFASCSSDIDANDGGKKTPELKITAIIKQDPSQKITLVNQDNTLMPTWQETDIIYAVWKTNTGYSYNEYHISEINDGVATFTPSLQRIPPTEGTKVHFIANAAFRQAELQLDFESGQTGALKDIASRAVMFASATVTNGELFLEFENQMSVVCVNKFTGLKPFEKYSTFSINSPTKATIRIENDELTFTTDESSCTDILCSSSNAIMANAQGEIGPIYFLVPPQKAREHTFTVTGKISSEREYIASKTYQGTLSTAREIGRNKFIYLESKRMGLSTKGVWAVTPLSIYNEYYNHTNKRLSCRWVQLWENGPLWAEFNVGAGILNYSDIDYDTYKEELYKMQEGGTFSNNYASPYLFYIWGGHYSFKGAKEYIAHADAVDNTAKTLWGAHWRTPTKDELQGLIDNCEWTYHFRSNSPYFIEGWIVSGKGDYSQNSIFLPLAGNSDQNRGNGHPYYWLQEQMPEYGSWYWSSESGYGLSLKGHLLNPSSINVPIPTRLDQQDHPHGASVRAVINI